MKYYVTQVKFQAVSLITFNVIFNLNFSIFNYLFFFFTAVKAKMDVTVSVHVYSVQRAELKDSSPLYSTDYDAVKENLKNCNK